tara:strand:- start:5449 stop:6504 length:1056 start_codon:yes stop_codon:yes gene_type:complete
MPAFPPTDTSADNPYIINDPTTKSWGIYGNTDKVHYYRLDGIKGEEMTISLNKNKKDGYYDLAIWGEGLNSINCTKDWYGWAHMINGVYMTRDLSELPEEVRSVIGDQEAFVLHGDAKEPVEYEPFGVGIYFPTGGCKDLFPSSSTYNMALIPGKGEVVGYSLGVGMVERFGLDELIIMPFVMTRTFEWGGRSLATILIIWFASFFIAAVVKYYMFFTVKKEYKLLDNDGGTVPIVYMTSYYLIWCGACGLIASGISFTVQLLWCALRIPSGNYLGAGVWVAIIAHIFIPIALGVTMLISVHIREILINYKLKMWKTIGVLAGGLYGLFLGWQAFVVFPLFIIVGSIIHLI